MWQVATGASASGSSTSFRCILSVSLPSLLSTATSHTRSSYTPFFSLRTPFFTLKYHGTLSSCTSRSYRYHGPFIRLTTIIFVQAATRRATSPKRSQSYWSFRAETPVDVRYRSSSITARISAEHQRRVAYDWRFRQRGDSTKKRMASEINRYSQDIYDIFDPGPACITV